MTFPTCREDINILSDSDVKICHCPGAALHGGYGVTHARIPELIDAGLVVGLGSDGAPSCNFNDMVRIMYLAAGIHKDFRKDPSVMPAELVLEMATIYGARALCWEEQIGSIEVGKRGDIAIFDTHRPEWLPLLNPISNLVYAASGDSCETVIIDGKIVMENREIMTFNENKVISQATEMAKNIMDRIPLTIVGKWPVE